MKVNTIIVVGVFFMENQTNEIKFPLIGEKAPRPSVKAKISVVIDLNSSSRSTFCFNLLIFFSSKLLSTQSFPK